MNLTQAYVLEKNFPGTDKASTYKIYTESKFLLLSIDY